MSNSINKYTFIFPKDKANCDLDGNFMFYYHSNPESNKKIENTDIDTIDNLFNIAANYYDKIYTIDELKKQREKYFNIAIGKDSSNIPVPYHNTIGKGDEPLLFHIALIDHIINKLEDTYNSYRPFTDDSSSDEEKEEEEEEEEEEE